MLNIGLLHISFLHLYCLLIIYTNFLTKNVFFFTCSISSFIHEIEPNKFRVFRNKTISGVTQFRRVYCVEKGGGVSPGWNGKKGEGDPYVEV